MSKHINNHQLAHEPSIVLALASLLMFINRGAAITAITPSITIAIISSISVNP
ncbi:Uncharacterised protein [Vibrio cholerae]|nr:Uncharacterised protein [Vibrio cholerae]